MRLAPLWYPNHTCCPCGWSPGRHRIDVSGIIRPDNSAALGPSLPDPIMKLLMVNGKECRDRLSRSKDRQPTGQHAFDPQPGGEI